MSTHLRDTKALCGRECERTLVSNGHGELTGFMLNVKWRGC